MLTASTSFSNVHGLEYDQNGILAYGNTVNEFFANTVSLVAEETGTGDEKYDLDLRKIGSVSETQDSFTITGGTVKDVAVARYYRDNELNGALAYDIYVLVDDKKLYQVNGLLVGTKTVDLTKYQKIDESVVGIFTDGVNGNVYKIRTGGNVYSLDTGLLMTTVNVGVSGIRGVGTYCDLDEYTVGFAYLDGDGNSIRYSTLSLDKKDCVNANVDA